MREGGGRLESGAGHLGAWRVTANTKDKNLLDRKMVVLTLKISKLVYLQIIFQLYLGVGGVLALDRGGGELGRGELHLSDAISILKN